MNTDTIHASMRVNVALRTANFSWAPAASPDASPWLRMFRNVRAAVG